MNTSLLSIAGAVARTALPALSLAVIARDADKSGYVGPNGKFLGKASGVPGLKCNFEGAKP